MKTQNLLFLVLFTSSIASAQNAKQYSPGDYLKMNWIKVATDMPADWYSTEEAKMVADSVLKYQTDIGGWAKNSGFHRGGVKQEEWYRIVKYGIGATFDNDATLTEMKFLTNIFTQTGDERYRDAFMKGYNYIFQAQYPNGGWPQFYPYRKRKSAYSSHITYNDDVMVNIMRFLDRIIKEDPMYTPMRLNTAMKERAKTAFDKGLDCILKTQISVNGEPAVWCAQHDEFTLKPAGARSYELPSFSGGESVGIVFLLMDLDNPSREIIDAVNGAVKWFEDHKIEGIRIEEKVNDDGQKDRIVVQDDTAHDLWARFYDLETEEPFFCDRDGIKKRTLAEIGINRRGGYNWYTDKPAKLFDKYEDWIAKINQPQL